MMRLLKVEIGRLMSRRLFRVAAVVGLIAVLAVDGLIAAKSNKNVAAAEKRANVVLQPQYQDCLAHVTKDGARAARRSRTATSSCRPTGSRTASPSPPSTRRTDRRRPTAAGRAP